MRDRFPPKLSLDGAPGTRPLLFLEAANKESFPTQAELGWGHPGTRL